MAIASDFLIWQENGHIACRVTTNADLGKLRTGLQLSDCWMQSRTSGHISAIG